MFVVAFEILESYFASSAKADAQLSKLPDYKGCESAGSQTTLLTSSQDDSYIQLSFYAQV